MGKFCKNLPVRKRKKIRLNNEYANKLITTNPEGRNLEEKISSGEKKNKTKWPKREPDENYPLRPKRTHSVVRGIIQTRY